jgi:DNA-binding winged helix-turn-helix (wHTH) protein
MNPFYDKVLGEFPYFTELSESTCAVDYNIYALSFRGYRVYTTARKLVHNGTEVAIGGRAFDLLVILLLARGRLISKEEIVRHVWPSTTVDDCNLRFQMAVLRKALGQDRDVIKTVPGRGYLFAEEISKLADEEVSQSTLNDSSGRVLADPDEIPSISGFTLGHERRDIAAASTCRSPPGALDDPQRTIDQLQADLVEIVSEIVRLRGATPVHGLGRLILIVPEGGAHDSGSRTIGHYAEA